MGKGQAKTKAGTAANESFLFWDQIKPHDSNLKAAALEQLIDAWKTFKDNTCAGDTWGDEIEYQIVQLDNKDEEARLSLKQDVVLDNAENQDVEYEWQPEYAKYMAESAPKAPFGSRVEDLAKVHTSMAKRRKELQSLIGHRAHPLTMTVFPLLGSSDNTFSGDTDALQHSTYNSSRDVPDEVISTRTRYRILEANARGRRGGTMTVKVPRYRENETTSASTKTDNERYIEVEGTIFGAGACGLQTTMETKSLEEACELHDQLCALGPIMLALTASSPIFKGQLADIDARWNSISQSFDDRTEEEMKTLGKRWAPCHMYLSDLTSADLAKSDCYAEESVLSKLQGAGMSSKLARYYANYFTRSILLVSQEDLDGTADPNGPSLWVRLAGTVFPHVRFKMPESDKDGWRVEFRPMEVQFTDFQNAALAVFVTLFRQLVGKHKLDFRIPIKDIIQDIENAHARDGCRKERFWWRCLRRSESDSTTLITDHEPTLLSLDQIFNASPESHDNSKTLGLVPAIRQYVEEKAKSEKSLAAAIDKISSYLDFVQHRASGSQPTGASFIRDIVMKHKDYKDDGKISQAVCYDIVKAVKQLVDEDLADVL